MDSRPDLDNSVTNSESACPNNSGTGGSCPPQGAGAHSPETNAVTGNEHTNPGSTRVESSVEPPDHGERNSEPSSPTSNYSGTLSENREDETKDDTDCEENPGAVKPAEVIANPTFASWIQFPGYNNIGFESATVPPPAYEAVVASVPLSRDVVLSLPTVSEQDARDAIIQHVSEHCCYGHGAAIKMQFKELISASAFQYTLETFVERRSTKWASEPYDKTDEISVTGTPPDAWDIQVNSPMMFVTSSVDVEVPNTESVEKCYKCSGKGKYTCMNCYGRGRTTCAMCGGTGSASYYDNGQYRTRSCTCCTGGSNRCYYCHGDGKVTCDKCDGKKHLRWFIQLTVEWTDHLDGHIFEKATNLGELLKVVTGQVAFEEAYLRLSPLSHLPEEINVASDQLISKHSLEFGSERILMQRQRVNLIPVTDVSYTYKNKNSSFLVYGNEHKVFAPDYPDKYCCGCSVL